MQQYRHFGQGESAVFYQANTINNNSLVGTSNVGPCIVLFLHDPDEKSCFAIHFDDRINFAAIKQQISGYLTSTKNTRNMQAFLIGGWEYFKASDQALVDLLGWLHKKKLKINLDNLYKKHGTPRDVRRIHYYASIVFNIATGELCFLNQENNLILTPSVDYFAKQKEDCFNYIRNNAIPLSESIKNIQLPEKTSSDSVQHTKKFFNDIIKYNNATPIIPAINFDDAYKKELSSLVDIVKSGNALETIKWLYSSFVNPASAISSVHGDTPPLHYACIGLNNNPGNYEREIIILLILLHAQRDLPNKEGKSALSLLRDVAFKTKCEELLAFIQLQKPTGAVNYEFIKNYRTITAYLVYSIIEYRKSPYLMQTLIHNQLTDHFKTLRNTPLPGRAARSLNYIVFMLAIIFFVCKFYTSTADAATCSALTRNTKRNIM